MPKKKNLNRFMSFLLAFCMAVALLPAQALAVSADDDPSTWPAPDSQYTAPGKNPVYIYLDYSTGEGIRGGHRCNPGATLNRDFVKATATTSGYAKYTCSDCGSWAQINVPALPASAFKLNPAYQSIIDNGVEYNGKTHTVGHDIASAYQRFAGSELTNNVNVVDAGSYTLQVTIDSDIYDHVVHQTGEILTIHPKLVPWNVQLENKVYDGTSLLAGKTASYTDVTGKTVNVPMKAYLSTRSNGESHIDTAYPVTSPVAAGVYCIQAEITDKNYKWSTAQGTANATNTYLVVYPKADAIYVGDAAGDVNLTTGNSSNVSAFNWVIDNTYSGFDSSRPGTTQLQLRVTRKSGASFDANVTVPVTVKARSVLSVESVSRSAALGTAFNKLNLPTTVSVTAEGGKTVNGVPVTWNSSGYNANTKNQTVTGTLNVSSIPELSNTNLPTARASITLSNNAATTPTINNYTKTYDGRSTALPLPTMPTGIQSASVTYSGTSNAGNSYSSSTPPTNAGTYTATISFTMASGYDQLSNMTASYTINKAPQTCAKPTLSNSTASSLTLNTVQDAEYSKDGTTWQASPTFSNLTAGQSYTLYQRLKATSDGNYEESPAASASFTTTQTTVQAPTVNNYTKTYDGKSTALPLPTMPTGIQSASVTYSGTSSNGSSYSNRTAPTNAGTYTATVSFTMADGYAPLSDVTASYTINKAPQTCAKPTLSAKTTSSLTLNTVQNAEYSKDGTTWQASPVFSGLSAGTEYTLYQRLKATSDGNYEESPAVSEKFTTEYNTVTAPAISDFTKTYDGKSTALPLPTAPAGIQSMTVFYRGTSVSGNPYSSNRPPVNVGNYTAAVSFVMENGYAQLPSVDVKYTIGKASQNFPEPVLSSATTTTLTLVAVDNAEYSMDGKVWQDSPTFRNLDPGTTYTLYQRLKGGSGGNYEETPTTSGQFTTEYESAGDLNLQAQSYPYTGNAISYKVPTIPHVKKVTITYTVNGKDTSTAPVNVGNYPVKLTFDMQAGTTPLDPVTTTLTITKINRNAPNAPKASNTATNSITITAIPGAEFSIDGGKTWQASTIFEGLTPDTAYTIQAKYPGDQNHYESPVSSSVIRTTRQNTSAGTVQSAVYTYDGTPKSLTVDVPLGCTAAVQSFTGTNGAAYGPTTTAPTNPGTYSVKVSYTMQNGYEELQPQYANLTINKATPKRPDAPVVTGVTDSSITIKVEDGMAYSIDGGNTWQTTDTFGGLNRDTMYEIKVKAVETPCYKELEGPSTMQATEKTLVTFEKFADQTVEYNGHAQTYTLPKSNTGISSMKITGYDSISTPPVTVGDYTVNIDFVAADGFKLPAVLPTPVLHITRASGEGGMVRPVLKDETVTYTGNPQRYHGADDIVGIASAALTYTGIDGTNYPESTTAPTNAGTYSVTAIFSPDANHTLAAGDYTAVLTIRKAAQNTPMAALENSASSSLTVTAVPGAEYSIDGENWQDNNVFTGLGPDQSYTILVRMKEDENHLPSGTRPVVGTTTNIPVDVLKDGMPDYSTIYNGNRQPYPYTYLAANIEGVKTVSVMYVGAMANDKPYESSEAPVNAGTYKVRFYLTAEENYDLSADQLYANMTISKAPQTMDTAPTIANRTTTTIALNPVPGAEYSIDGGKTWQDSPKFTGLTPDTTYTFTQRLKETDNLTASDSQSVDGKTFADTGLKYDIDFREEVIHFDPNVVEGGWNYAMTDAIPDGSAVTPGGTIYIHLIDDGTGKPGPIVMDVLPKRPATPDVKVNPYDFTMNTTTDMEYSDDGGETWKPCDERQLVEDRQGDTLLVRIAATDDSFRSDACTVVVPVRGPAPLVLISTETERMDCTAAMEYSSDNGETWVPCLDNMAMSDMTGKALLVRYACDGVNPASRSTEITVPTRNTAPVPSIDMNTELLTATGTYPEYWTGSEWSGLMFIGLDVSELCGKEVLVRESFDAEHFASLPVTVQVPGRGEKPEITIDRDKQTIDTTSDMEYSTDGGNTWVKCDPDMDVSNLTGETILVRKAATDDTFASEPVEVRIPNRTEKPDITLNTEDETINTTTDMEYSTDGGKTWNPCTEPLDVSDLTGQTVLIRDKGDEDSFPSEGVPIVIPDRRDAPKIIVDNHAETVSSDAGTEISFDGGKTWMPFEKPLQTASHKGETFLLRYPATKDDFASRSVVVVIPYRHGAPVLSFDPDSETINTTPGMEYSTDGGKTWYPVTGPLDVSDLTGKDILVRYPSDGTDLPGESTTVKVPMRRKAPDVGHTDETRLGRKDGALTETDKTMEYRLTGGRWTAITGSTVKNLAPGVYEVRYTATDMDVASAIQTVTIAAGKDTGSNDNNGNGNNSNNGNNGNQNGGLTGNKLALLNRKDHMGYISGRTATQAAPSANITRAEVAAILYRLLTADAKSAYTTKINSFSDVSGSAWYNTAVSTLANIGVIDGYQDGTFGPQRNITRAELATILARFCETADTSKDYFNDISGSWARQYINQAAKAGLVQGYSDGTFRPNQNITRAETIVMVNRILGRSVTDENVVRGYKTFEDVPVGSWYYWDVVEASNAHSYNKNGSTETWTALG